MNFRANFGVLFLALAGCGGNPCDDAKCAAGQVCEPATGLCSSSSDGQPKNGSRLRVRVWKGDDGTLQPAGFFDTTRNEDCSPSLADDGKTRCLPTSAYVNRSANQFFYFADASCSTYLVELAASDCITPAYLELQSSACGVGPSYQPLSAIATPATVYSLNGAGNCVAQTAPTAKQWLQAGAKEPATNFVAMTLE